MREHLSTHGFAPLSNDGGKLIRCCLSCSHVLGLLSSDSTRVVVALCPCSRCSDSRRDSDPTRRATIRPMTTPPPRLAPVPTAATAHDITARTVWRYLEIGHLTRYRAGHKTLVDLDQLDALLAPKPAN